MDRITLCIREMLSWSDTQLLRDIIFVLATQGWQKAVDEMNDLKFIDRLVDKFISLSMVQMLKLKKFMLSLRP